MERIRNAMAREKAKAEKFHERQQQSNLVSKRDTNQFGPSAGNNPLALNKNLEGFSK